jgi:hypothetical protein
MTIWNPQELASDEELEEELMKADMRNKFGLGARSHGNQDIDRKIAKFLRDTKALATKRKLSAAGKLAAKRKLSAKRAIRKLSRSGSHSRKQTKKTAGKKAKK